MNYASVILDVAIDKALDYSIPQELSHSILKGTRVEVPLKGKLQCGYVMAIKETTVYSSVKPISKVLREERIINDDLFDLAIWMAKYYCTPLHKIFKVMIPSSLRSPIKQKEQLYVMRAKTCEELSEHCVNIRHQFSAQASVLECMLQVNKGILLTDLLEKTKVSRNVVQTLAKKGFLKVDLIRIDRSPLVNADYLPTKPKKLTLEQQATLEKITSSLKGQQYATHLIQGVTGSGKTEVYLQAIDYALKQGKGIIVLVPEIALTAQTIERFRSRFEGNIAILHHRLSHGERLDEWQRINRGEAKIVIGARSAIFSPVVNLGLIIVDEEHENSYKQTDEMPCYHARDIAVMRGKMLKATVVLGSATPSLESYYNAKREKYILSKLTARADAASLPMVMIIDMNKEKEKRNLNFSDILLSGIQKRLDKGEQTILFLNRRGYHTFLKCLQCQRTIKCKHCDVSLTFHLGENTLACHLCGFSIHPPPKHCPSCLSAAQMKFRGVGTEQIEKALHAIFPDVRTLRMDGDTTKHKGSHQMLLRAFASGKADVLIGTQMIAKGLHFPGVTLVGVLNSDHGLNIPDFRSSENVFQLLTQVAGRAGRESLAGEVIIQTFLPDNGTIRLASKQDYENFYSDEMAVRDLFQYPPFTQMVKFAFSGADDLGTKSFAESFLSRLQKFLPSSFKLNPVIPAGHTKVKDNYYYQFIILGPSIMSIHAAYTKLLEQMKMLKNIKIRVDINPISTFF